MKAGFKKEFNKKVICIKAITNGKIEFKNRVLFGPATERQWLGWLKPGSVQRKNRAGFPENEACMSKRARMPDAKTGRILCGRNLQRAKATWMLSAKTGWILCGRNLQRVKATWMLSAKTGWRFSVR